MRTTNLLNPRALLYVMLVLLLFPAQAVANDYLIQMGGPAHKKFGLYYPVTYRFWIPENVRPLSVNYRYSNTDSWRALPERTAADSFNGIEAVRFDYGARLAYVSVSFTRTSDELYLRMLDPAGQPVEITFDAITPYYDGRRSAVTVSLDDYADWSASSFETALQYLDSLGMHATVAVIAGQVNNWSLLQQMINRYGPRLEIASHGVTHLCSAGDYLSFGYGSEVTGSRDTIRNRLSYPAHPYVPVYAEPCGYSDTTLQASISAGEYLASRSVNRGGSFTAWDPAEGRYGRAVISFDDYTYTNDAKLLADANAVFDRTLADGNIYHLLNHPATGLWHDASYLLQHLDHVKGRNDVWYVPVGGLHQYHFVQEWRGGLSITSHESTPGQPPANRIPVADAGTNQVVTQGARVTLDGSRSYDPDNDTLTYRWTQLQGPSVTLSAVDTAHPVFTAPASDMPLLFQLEVSDGKSVSGPDTVRIETVPAVRTISTSAVGSGSIACAPGTTVTDRTSVTCTVTANPHNHIAELTIDGVRQALTNATTFTRSFGPVTSDHAIMARFSLDTYSVRFISGEGGTLTGTPAQTVTYGGSTAAVTAVPSTGYHFLSWTADGGLTSTSNPITLSNVTADRTATATFERDMLTVQFISGGNGSIDGPASQTVRYGDSTATVTAVPAAGYRFDSWTAPGGFTSTANPLVVRDVAQDRVFTARFVVETCDIRFVSTGNGSITGPAVQKVPCGAPTAAVTAVPAAGFRFAKWTSSDGTSSSDNPYILARVTASVTISAHFADTHTVAVGACDNGTVQPSAPQSVEHGGSVAFTLVPAEGYHAATAGGCGGSLKGSVYTTGPVTADCSVSVTFARNEFTVTGAAAGIGGTVSCVSPVVYGGASSCTIEAANGFTLFALSDNGAEVTVAANMNRYDIPLVSANHVVSATFTGRSYTVSDAVLAQQLVLGKLQASDAEMRICDVAPLGEDGTPRPDGVVDVADVVVMLRRLVGVVKW